MECISSENLVNDSTQENWHSSLSLKNQKVRLLLRTEESLKEHGMEQCGLQLLSL